jgi:hypothetical protein
MTKQEKSYLERTEAKNENGTVIVTDKKDGTFVYAITYHFIPTREELRAEADNMIAEYGIPAFLKNAIYRQIESCQVFNMAL